MMKLLSKNPCAAYMFQILVFHQLKKSYWIIGRLNIVTLFHISSRFVTFAFHYERAPMAPFLNIINNLD